MHKIGADREQAEFLLSLVPLPDGSRNAPRISEWHVVSSIARQHGLLPQIFCRLPEWEGAMPEDHVRLIREEGYRNAARNCVLAAELLRRLAAFNRAGIPALPFKGAALAAQLYGDLAHRPAGDIDILIHFADLHRAAAVMKEAGYILHPSDPDAQEFQFTRESDGIVVELRWRLSPSWFRRDFGMNALWPHRRTSMLLGTAIPSLSPEHTLILLCLHGTKHEWTRLFWVCDVVQLLSLHRDMDWSLIERDARRFGLWGSVALGVLLSHRLGGVDVEETILRRFKRSTRVLRLERHIREHLFDARYRPLDGLPNQHPVLGFRDRIRSLLKAGVAAPNLRDREFIHLPRKISFLYYLVRPLRLTWDHVVVKRAIQREAR